MPAQEPFRAGHGCQVSAYRFDKSQTTLFGGLSSLRFTVELDGLKSLFDLNVSVIYMSMIYMSVFCTTLCTTKAILHDRLHFCSKHKLCLQQMEIGATLVMSLKSALPANLSYVPDCCSCLQYPERYSTHLSAFL